ncbi:MAG: hypothetical protein ACE5FV_03715 [Woeseia sp.]
MRPMIGLYLVSALAEVAGAHTLSGDESLFAQIGHHLFSLHHMPLMAILILGGVAICRVLLRRGGRVR